MLSFPIYKGNCPRNVARDAKYSVRSGHDGTSVVALSYRSLDDERWYMTSEEHPELVWMVNQVKQFLGLPPNGSFYINEFKQVIVPSARDTEYYFAGIYERPLRFEFEGNIISGESIDFTGKPLRPGDIWIGPHAGIPYKLCAGGRDISYEIEPRPYVTKDVKLSKAIGPEAAYSVASNIVAFKGTGGGRFYANEFCSLFAPIQNTYATDYIYIGQLDLINWFTKQTYETITMNKSTSNDHVSGDGSIINDSKTDHSSRDINNSINDILKDLGID